MNGDIFAFAQTGGHCWYLVGKGQGCDLNILQCIARHSSPTAKNYLAPNINHAQAAQPQSQLDSGLEATHLFGQVVLMVKPPPAKAGDVRDRCSIPGS